MGTRLTMGCGGGKEEKETDIECAPAPAPGGDKPRPKYDNKAAKRDMDEKYLRPLDADFQTFFDKYDLDDSKTMNSHDEIRQLALNLLTSLLHIKEFKLPFIREEVEKLSQEIAWSPDEYKDWFFKTFNFSPKSLADYSERAHISQELNKELADHVNTMKEKFGKRGEISLEQIEDAYSFVDTAEFLQACNKCFEESAGADAQEMGLADFEDAIEAFLTDMLKATNNIGDDDNCVQINKADVKEWFSLVDSDGSGKVSKGEFGELIKFFVLNYQVKSTQELKTALEACPPFKDFNDNFRMGGNCHMDNERGCFTLVRGKFQRAVGHFLCRAKFDAKGDVYVKFKYQCNPREDKVWEADKKAANAICGEGLCVYLVDPSKEKWDEDFDGEGVCGFQGKAGGLFGCFLDLGGNICGKDKDHVAIAKCEVGSEIIAAEKYTKGTGLRTKQCCDKWRKVEVHFNTDDKKVSVKVGGKKVIDSVHLDIEFPEKICVGICAGTSKDAHARFSVNDLSFDNDPNEDEDESSDEE